MLNKEDVAKKPLLRKSILQVIRLSYIHMEFRH